ARNRSARSGIWVDLPLPSVPSKVMKSPFMKKGQRNILSGAYLLFHQLTFLRRKQGAHVLGVRPFLQSFFNFGPFGVSSMAQPLAFSSSRMASARLKSFDFFA